MKKIKSKLDDFTENKYGSLIYVSWLVLICCFVVKIFGLNIFELESENSLFVKLCDFIDENVWLKMVLANIICLVSSYFILCIMLNNKRLNAKQLIVFLPLLIAKSLISWYNSFISLLLDIIIMLGITSAFNKNFLRNIICFALVLSFQLITIVLRNLSFDFNESNCFLKQILYQIDYYIMILLFYLYNFRKEKTNKIKTKEEK